MDIVDISKPMRGRCSLAEISSLVAEVKAGLEIETVGTTYYGIQDLDNSFVPISCRSMELILWELCENVKKFHSEGSPVIEINIASVPDGIQIQVRDDGVTLSPEQLAETWIPYYQGDRGFSGQVSGMGLGLATVSVVVCGVGGTCRAYNRKEGPGVVVELVLPVER